MLAQPKLLVVEDDDDLRDSLKELLQEQYRVISAGNGAEGLALAQQEKPNAIILDVMMPKSDGFSMVTALRKDSETRCIPVLMLTALSDLQNRLKAFELGADDFLAKPFEPAELLVRVAAKLRLQADEKRCLQQGEEKADPAVIRCGNLTMDPRNLSASVDGRPVRLSLLEFNLLKYLAKHRNKLRTRKQILLAVWKDPNASERLLDPHMMVIRRKLEGFDHEIASIYGGGYILRPRLDLPQG
jgi:two-component system response regulator MprA